MQNKETEEKKNTKTSSHVWKLSWEFCSQYCCLDWQRGKKRYWQNKKLNLRKRTKREDGKDKRKRENKKSSKLQCVKAGLPEPLKTWELFQQLITSSCPGGKRRKKKGGHRTEWRKKQSPPGCAFRARSRAVRSPCRPGPALIPPPARALLSEPRCPRGGAAAPLEAACARACTQGLNWAKNLCSTLQEGVQVHRLWCPFPIRGWGLSWCRCGPQVKSLESVLLNPCRTHLHLQSSTRGSTEWSRKKPIFNSFSIHKHTSRNWHSTFWWSVCN